MLIQISIGLGKLSSIAILFYSNCDLDLTIETWDMEEDFS